MNRKNKNIIHLKNKWNIDNQIKSERRLFHTHKDILASACYCPDLNKFWCWKCRKIAPDEVNLFALLVFVKKHIEKYKKRNET